MYTIINNQGDLLAIQITGKLEGKDYDTLTPILEEKIKQHDSINLYWEMKDFEGWNPEALWADLKFDFKNANNFKRIALVGEKKWEKTMSDFMKPFTNAEVKYFDATQSATAMAWAKSHAIA